MPIYIAWTPCHVGPLSPRKAWRILSLQMETDGLQLWRSAANTLNKQWQTADRGCASSLEVGRGSNNPSPQKISLLQKITLSLEFGWISK
jgi:hypothetical protein